MTRLLTYLLDPAYLYATNPGPLGRWAVVYVAWAFALLLGLGAAVWWLRRTQHTAAQATAWACGVGLAFLGLRVCAPSLADLRQALGLPKEAQYLLYEAWTARVWPISATLVAACVPVIYGMSRVHLPRIVRCQVDAMVGVFPTTQDRHSRAQALPLAETMLLAALHLAGLAWLWHLAGHPTWWAIPSLIALTALPWLVRPRRLHVEMLAPLFPVYLAALATYLLSQRLRVDVQEYSSFPLPDLWSPWFNVPIMVAAGIAYTLTIELKFVAQQCRPTLRDVILPAAIGLLSALWLAGTVAVHRTHGVTASDPYCYAQMAIDLAENGNALHEFPLAGLARSSRIPTWPTVHIGYHAPSLENRSPTMWPIGWPVLMVPLYWLGGLDALYLAAPGAVGLSLVATWFLANQALDTEPRATRWTAAALTCALVATSPEGSERMLVPMADAAAQLFVVLTLWLLLRARQGHPMLHAALAGASFGMAYWIRHPVLPLAISAPVALWPTGSGVGRRDLGRRFASLTLFGLAALLGAIPDLLHHKATYGGWLNAESSEWFLISLDNIGRSLFSIAERGLLRREELGFLAFSVLYGVWVLWQRRQRSTLVLCVGFLAVFAFHLFYAALRPRDLIAVLPVLYLCAGYGSVVAWRAAQQRRTLGAALLLLCMIILLFARSGNTLAMPWRRDVITFGHVSEGQYEGFVMLGALTPKDAVIGSMLNGGAIELHAERSAVHPAPWTADELHQWVNALLTEGRPFYVLDDGEEMPAVLTLLEKQYQVQPVQRLNLPYFAIGGGNIPRSVWLYEIVEMSSSLPPVGETRGASSQHLDLKVDQIDIQPSAFDPVDHLCQQSMCIGSVVRHRDHSKYGGMPGVLVVHLSHAHVELAPDATDHALEDAALVL